MLDYEYIKNNFKLVGVDLCSERQLDADLKAIQQIEFIEELKNNNDENSDVTQSMVVVTTVEKKGN